MWLNTMRCLKVIGILVLCAGGLLVGCARPTAAPPVKPPVNKTAAQVPILMYHHIAASPNPQDARVTGLHVTPAQLDQQLDYLQRAGYTTITLDDLTAALQTGAALPARPLILTFDDGYQDFYTAAYPILQRYKVKATIYIITGRVGKPGYLNWEQLAELAASPLITIGAHTRTHPQLAKHSAGRVRDELNGGRADLEQHLHISVHHLAYPSGSYDKQTIEQARNSGYVTAVTVHSGIRERADKLLEMPRVFVKGDASLQALIAVLEDKPAPTQPVGED